MSASLKLKPAEYGGGAARQGSAPPSCPRGRARRRLLVPRHSAATAGGWVGFFSRVDGSSGEPGTGVHGRAVSLVLPTPLPPPPRTVPGRGAGSTGPPRPVASAPLLAFGDRLFKSADGA